MQYSVYYINNNKKEILAISRRSPNIFETSGRLSEVHKNISDHFPKASKMSKDFRRLPKVAEYFQTIFEDVSII